ncbi:MAG: squalene/phytoene synthase family protein [Thermoanaerobaculia bacterium]|nr:squalene/phytoene synthase family protein [Thermoanaerobaculia bacterium]
MTVVEERAVADPSESSLETAYAYCRKLTHRYGANFSVGFRFLPRPKRQAVYAAYAFCRLADDIADDPGMEISERLDRWQEELDRCYDGRPGHLVTIALSDALKSYPIPKAAFVDLIDGCRQDLVKTRYESFEELVEYCRLVAASISDISLAIFGYSVESAVDHGRDLSTALQLTNITRDVGDDLERDRIYIPAEDLERFGVTEDDLFSKKRDRNMLELIRFQSDRARSYFVRAQPLIAEIDSDARFPVTLMGSIYSTVLDEIDKDPLAVLDRRVALSLPRKVRVVLSRTFDRRFVR